MPVRDGRTRPTSSPGTETTAPTTPPAEAVAPVRVYSLTGVGYVDEKFGVSFTEHPYADVAPDLAQRMVAHRPEVVKRDADGVDIGVEPGTEPQYSLTAPAESAIKWEADNPVADD